MFWECSDPDFEYTHDALALQSALDGSSQFGDDVDEGRQHLELLYGVVLVGHVVRIDATQLLQEPHQLPFGQFTRVLEHRLQQQVEISFKLLLKVEVFCG